MCIRHDPDYPRLGSEVPAEPYCNVPSYTRPIKPRMYQRGGGSPLPVRKQDFPDPGMQAPPKKLDDLMASFGQPPVSEWFSHYN